MHRNASQSGNQIDKRALLITLIEFIWAIVECHSKLDKDSAKGMDEHTKFAEVRWRVDKVLERSLDLAVVTIVDEWLEIKDDKRKLDVAIGYASEPVKRLRKARLLLQQAYYINCIISKIARNLSCIEKI